MKIDDIKIVTNKIVNNVINPETGKCHDLVDEYYLRILMNRELSRFWQWAYSEGKIETHKKCLKHSNKRSKRSS